MRHSFFLSMLALSVIPLSLGACAPVDDDVEDDDAVGTAQDELVGGSYASTGQYPSTVFLTIAPGFKSFCTGVKVAPRLLMTAGHCVYKQSTKSYLLKPGEKLAVTNRVTVDRASGIGEVVTVKRVLAHPSWVQYGANGAWASPVPADVGLLEVESGLGSIPTAELSVAKVPVGASVHLQGYGCEQGLSGQPVGDLARLKYKLTTTTDTATAFKGTFAYTNQAPQTTLAGSYFFTRGQGATSTAASLCPGDSGGPVYRSISGKRYVVGVNAYYSFTEANQSISANNWFTRVDYSNDIRHDTGSWLAFHGARIGHR